MDKQNIQDCLVELGTLTIRLVDYFSDFQETYLVGRVKTYQAKYGPQDDQQMSDEEDDQLKRILELSKLTATQVGCFPEMVGKIMVMDFAKNRVIG